jgi:hypothetical protein
MTTYKHLFWFAPAVLIVAVMVGANLRNTTEISQPDTKEIEQIEVQHEESGLKTQDVKQIEVRKEQYAGLKNQNIQAIDVQQQEKPDLKTQEVRAIEIRKQEEQRLKKQDKYYAQQAKAMAEQYEERARFVERNGGNAQALYDAADYFAKESK